MNRLSPPLLVLLAFASTACSPVVIDEREVCGSGEVTVFAKLSLFAYSSLALDATHVYWLEVNQIMVAPKSGGPPAVFADNLPLVDWIAVDENNLYAQMRPDQGVVGIYSLGKTGNTPPKLVVETKVVSNPVLDQDRIYWSVPGLSFVPKEGGAPTLLHDDNVYAFALDQERAYWIDNSTSDPGLVSVPKLTPLPQQKLPHIVEVPEGATPVVADGERVYFWSGTDIVSVPNAGGDPTVLASESGPVGNLLVDPECLFWALGPKSAQEKGTVRAARRGGEVVTVSTGPGLIFSLAADRSGVYWVDTDKSAIMKLSR